MDTVGLSEDGEKLVLIDQTRLPGEVAVLRLSSQEEIREAIRSLRVRGAPAIGVAAAFGAYLAAREIETEDYGEFCARFAEKKEYLASARPTAVNLFWALDRMERVVKDGAGRPVREIVRGLRSEADRIRDEDILCCRRIGENGVSLLRDGFGVLTHCNAGRLAAVRYGTALAPVYVGMEQGMKFRMFCDETRPLLQGARLTAYELCSAGADTTLICDDMAASVMKKGWIQAVFVGADRIAANGDTANKIGTSGVAVLAARYGVPFYVCAPRSTFDLNCGTGADITIEERPAEEVTDLWYGKRMAPEGVRVYNPAFDVTDSGDISAIVTESGVLRPPFARSIGELFAREGADSPCGAAAPSGRN